MPIEDLLFYIDFKNPDAVADTIEVVKRFGIEERIIMGAIPTDANLEVGVLAILYFCAIPDRTCKREQEVNCDYKGWKTMLRKQVVEWPRIGERSASLFECL